MRFRVRQWLSELCEGATSSGGTLALHDGWNNVATCETVSMRSLRISLSQAPKKKKRCAILRFERTLTPPNPVSHAPWFVATC